MEPVEDIAFVSQNENGDWYVGYKIKVPRGIRGKSKAIADELLIIGIPKNKFPAWLEKHGYVLRKENCDEEVVEES